MSYLPAKKVKKKDKKDLDPTGVEEIDRLADLSPCRMQDYITGVSTYVQQNASLASGPKKAAQIRLSNALSRSLADELGVLIPGVGPRLVTQERKIAGGLRTVNADVSEMHGLDGLRLAVELKPVNLAVGRAIWNRFGDIRTFAVNIHLKFPFAVIGGVLVIPTYEEMGTKAAKKAEEIEEAVAEGVEPEEQLLLADTVTALPDAAPEPEPSATEEAPAAQRRKSTVHLIARAIERLVRAGGRKSEADAPHLLEGIAVVVYNPETGIIEPDLPKPGSGLRWDEFVTTMAAAYRARFED